MTQFAADAWFSGFVDGEGCFRITPAGGGSRRLSLVPRFVLGLRDDDEPLIRALAAEFGGSVSVSRPSGLCPSWKVTWTVVGREDLARLLAYFDRFPLRARKAADYAVWRRAVALYFAARQGWAVYDEMAALKAELHGARAYELRAVA